MFRVNDLDMTFQGHSRSKVTTPNESPYILSYSCSILTIGLGSTVKKIFSSVSFDLSRSLEVKTDKTK